MLSLSACVSLDDSAQSDANEQQIAAMLLACRVQLHHIERLDAEGDQWVVSIDRREANRTAKMRCMDKEGKRLHLRFAMSGVGI